MKFIDLRQQLADKRASLIDLKLQTASNTWMPIEKARLTDLKVAAAPEAVNLTQNGGINGYLASAHLSANSKTLVQLIENIAEPQYAMQVNDILESKLNVDQLQEIYDKWTAVERKATKTLPKGVSVKAMANFIIDQATPDATGAPAKKDQFAADQAQADADEAARKQLEEDALELDRQQKLADKAAEDLARKAAEAKEARRKVNLAKLNSVTSSLSPDEQAEKNRKADLAKKARAIKKEKLEANKADALAKAAAANLAQFQAQTGLIVAPSQLTSLSSSSSSSSSAPASASLISPKSTAATPAPTPSLPKRQTTISTKELAQAISSMLPDENDAPAPKKKAGRPKKDADPAPASETEGKGLNTKKRNHTKTRVKKTDFARNIRLILGNGMIAPDQDNSKEFTAMPQIRLNKYMLDIYTLSKSNILKVKLVSNRNYSPNLKQQKVSDEVKNIITELAINSNFNMKLYNALSQDDKDVILTFGDVCHLDLGISSTSDFEMQLNIARGQIESGNTQQMANYKRLIAKGVDLRRISPAQGLKMLAEL